MLRKVVLKGRGLTKGVVDGEALVTRQPLNISRAFSFQVVTRQLSSNILDKKHELLGKDVAGKILIIPHNIGACTAGLTLFQIIKSGIGPKALVGIEIEPQIVAGAIFAKKFNNLEFPIVDRCDKNPLKTINTCDYIRVDGNKGVIEVIKRAQEYVA
jgi:hypothetical protein